MMIALQVITVLAVVAVLSLYLYDDGAHRVYDVVMSGVVIVVTCLVTSVLAIVSKAKTGKVFDRTDGLKFAAPADTAVSKLPFFFLVFVGKRRILPAKLRAKRQNETQDIA